MNKKQSNFGYYFLAATCLIYWIALFIDKEFFKQSLLSAWSIITQIYYVFIIIFVLMVLVDYFVKPSLLKKYLGGKSGPLGWLMAIVAGILSTGPIFMWFPLLGKLKKDGMRDSLVSVFLYNRAIKLHLIPIILHYFSALYIIVLTIVMIIASVIQGYLIELYLNKNKSS